MVAPSRPASFWVSEASETVDRSEIFIREIQKEFPHFRIIPKREDKLSHALHWVLFALTFGGQRHYLTRYHTVLGDTLNTPESWDSTSD